MSLKNFFISLCLVRTKGAEGTRKRSRLLKIVNLNPAKLVKYITNVKTPTPKGKEIPTLWELSILGEIKSDI
jgi:hypothetical protein